MPSHRILISTAVFAVLAFGPVAAVAEAPAPASPRQAIDDAWWTGPLLAAGASTLPKGHVLIEPYFYDFRTTGRFDQDGRRRHVPNDDSFGSQSYLLYGLTDDVTVGLIPHFGYRSLRNGTSSSGLQVGDLTLQGQYRLTKYREGSWVPTMSVVVQESLPIGKHDRLENQPNDGFGSGAYATSVGLNSQVYFWTPNGRILRTRLDLNYTRSAKAGVEGMSVYGTPTGFSGKAAPGQVFTADLAFEYSLTRRWVLALDLGYEHDAATRVAGTVGAAATPFRASYGSSEAFVLAPAVEYNFSSQLGVIMGARIVAAGRNTTSTVAPAIAINYVL